MLLNGGAGLHVERVIAALQQPRLREAPLYPKWSRKIRPAGDGGLKTLEVYVITAASRTDRKLREVGTVLGDVRVDCSRCTTSKL
ncbi:unnamed protein product, partial [Arctia plantaginis]